MKFTVTNPTIRSAILFIALSTSLMAMNEPAPKDPVARVDYRAAFDQQEIHQKHADLMRKMGCAENVFGKDKVASLASKRLLHSNDYIAINTENMELIDTIRSGNYDKFDRQVFEEACFAKLKWERTKIILEPAREGMTEIALLGVATGTLLGAAGSDSYGGSFGIFAALFNCIYPVRSIIRSGYNLYDTPPHPLDEFEKRFATNQCFIPKSIWSAVIDKFILARNNPFEQGKALDFIDFTLGLTVYAPKPSLSHFSVGAVDVNRLSRKITHFFEDYEPFKTNQQLHSLKMNVRQFVEQLMGGSESPRYIHLQGPGGIGKTHFAKKLNNWIEKMLPNSTGYELVVINSHEELEGTADRPGAFLRVLRNQCLANTTGSVVFIDEANWLGEESFNAASKRTFNGRQEKLSATYFGAGIDGTGVDLPVPLMLTLVASNKEITDEALKSRFDCVNFPMPKKDSLITYAHRLIRKHPLSGQIEGLLNGQRVSEKFTGGIMKVLGDSKSFRDIESTIPALLSEWYEESGH